MNWNHPFTFYSKLNDDKRDMDELEILVMQREEHRLNVSAKYDVEHDKVFW